MRFNECGIAITSENQIVLYKALPNIVQETQTILRRIVV